MKDKKLAREIVGVPLAPVLHATVEHQRIRIRTFVPEGTYMMSAVKCSGSKLKGVVMVSLGVEER